MDLQQRQTQHGDRRHHTRYETETIQNGRVVLASNSPTNGGITGAPTEPRQYFSETLDWELFPLGDIGAVLSSLGASGRLQRPDEMAIATERLTLFETFQPVNYIRGLAGNDTYVGAKYADDLVVFESVKYGNALYVLYVDWEQQSRQPRSTLLRLAGNELDRIVHRANWQDEFRELMINKLQERGISLQLK
jgi:hypothetical protein